MARLSQETRKKSLEETNLNGGVRDAIEAVLGVGVVNTRNEI